MWDRALFASRRFLLDLGGLLGSWRLSIVLMVVAGLYYALLAIWAGASPPHVVRNIAALSPFWLVYLLLLVNTGLCLWRRIPTLRRDLSREPRWSERAPDWRRPLAPGEGAGEARALARSLGYRVTIAEEERVVAVQRRWSALGTFLFHGAFFLVALGFLATLLARQEARVWVAVGEDYTARPDQVLSRSAPRLLGGGEPDLGFRVEEITPEFWRDQLLFTTLEAGLVLGGGERATTRINRPLWVGPATFLRLAGFGYAPRYELSDRRGEVLDSAFVKLNLFPPGQRDQFRIPGYPHRLYLEVLPDYVDDGGRAATRSLNLVRPATELQVYRGRLDLGGGLLVGDEGHEYEGLTLSFPEIRYWGEFSIVTDPGVPLLFLGYLVALAGLALKLCGRRREVVWTVGEGGGGGELRGWGGPPPPGTAGAGPAE